MVRDIREWRPRFYTEFRYESREHSGVAQGAVFRKLFLLLLIPRSLCSFFQKQIPKMVWVESLARGLSTNTSYIKLSGVPVFPGTQVIRNWTVFQHVQEHKSYQTGPCSSFSRIAGYRDEFVLILARFMDC